MASNQHTQTSANHDSGTSQRGFASMDPQRQREIASEGGKASHQSGHGHEFDSREAAQAGSKSHGGQGGSGGSAGTRGGSSEQHAEAGRQSHKNSH